MLIQKTDPKGIDKMIASYQAHLYNELAKKWDVSGYNSYGRCYRNRRTDGYVAEVYAGNNEYADVMLDDRLTAISFFGTGYKLSETATVHLVFFINIAAIKPAIAHRADEEIRLDLVNIAKENMYGLKFESVETGVENALKEYPQSIQDLPLADMHPWHTLRLNFKILVDNNFC